jgi:serine/threonine protein kinase
MTLGRTGDELIGKTLGLFEIQEEIGRGGMATVYRARQLTMNRIVAVKVLPRNLLHDPSFYERFEREVEVISHLEHPHIVPIYEYGQSDGMPYIVMRYLGGGSLEGVIRRHLPPLDTLEKPLRQIAQALDYAHQQGIIHRDLKPGNIMLDENGNAYLSDFGIARVLGSNITGSMIVGTPAYMSPEQANGLPIDARSDIYALGVVLFEMLTGREPYQAETPMAILLKHINEPIPPITDYRDDVPPAVEAVVNKATAKNPDHRYASASAMVEALSVALRGAPMPADDFSTTNVRKPATTPAAQVVEPPTSQLSPPPVSQSMPPARSNLPLVALLGVVLFLAIGGAAALFAASNRPTEDLTNLPPTPFPRAERITASNYTISIPSDWIPLGGFTDRSDGERQLHVWQANDGSASVSLAILDLEGTFEKAVATYDDVYYVPQELPRIDEATAENGTIRRSYRQNGGQLDVFYQEQGDTLTVLELYTADSTGNSLVQSLQLILDSLRINPSA